MRQLCGGNIYAIEKLIAFGKTLQNIYKGIKCSEFDERNKLLLKVSIMHFASFFSLVIPHPKKFFWHSNEDCKFYHWCTTGGL